MKLNEAMGWAATALETRASHWREAATSVFPDNAELYEADIDERTNMADMYEEALETLTTLGIVAMEVDEEGQVHLVNIKATSA